MEDGNDAFVYPVIHFSPSTYVIDGL